MTSENVCSAKPILKAIPEQMIVASDGMVWTVDSGNVICPGCGGFLIQDSEYPDDLLCGKCERAFDAKTMEEIPWNP